MLFLLIPLSFNSVFGVVENFTTDKSLYYEGDSLSISGSVSYDPEIPFVTIQIFTPGKLNFADFNTVPVNTDGSFSTVFHVGGPTWASDGIYPIKVTYDGNMEQSIEYKESFATTPEPESTSTSEPTPTSEPASTSEPTPIPSSAFTTLKLQIPNFPSLDKSPQSYIDRYNNEPSYKSWFDSQFPFNSITDVVGYKLISPDGFPSLDKSPQSYIDRYNNEPDYKSWFDSQFPHISIYNILGYDDPIPLPPEMKSDAGKWAIGEISDSTFVAEIEFMLENNIIMISNVPSGDPSGDEIPAWIRNNALWWSEDLISEYEFVNSLKFLIQEGIIAIN
jgi:hypothetical protein